MSICTLNNIKFDNMVIQNYPTHLQLNNANISDTQDSFVSISNDIVSTNKYDKRANFDFEMVMFLALHPMEFIFLNSYVLLKHLAMLPA